MRYYNKKGDSAYPQVGYALDDFGVKLGLGRRLSDILHVRSLLGTEFYRYCNLADKTYDNHVRHSYDEHGKKTEELGTITLYKMLDAEKLGYLSTNQLAAYKDVISNIRHKTIKQKNSAYFGMSIDSRNDLFNPSKGFFIKPGIEFAGGWLGGDDRYAKPECEFGYYWNFLWKMVYAFHSDFGVIVPNIGLSDLVIRKTDMFTLGGWENLRGWGVNNQTKNIPFDPYYEGLGRMYFNQEIRIPIAERMLWWVFFWDTGGLWGQIKNEFDTRHYLKHPYNTLDDMVNRTMLYQSAGFGLRIQIPMFPIRLYFSKRFTQSNGRFHWIDEDFNWVFDFGIHGLF